ncbi:hypothetical protein FPY71_09695 [Aureimonas fodinaquatilis]|uniref:Endonuclease/exonuclease/phosphatase domain-containing protein n=1 Tax=Aureimonas fodinaquatilis TaxID=2565783 RepID=A0A5B0DXK5_9HYPH|nr:endonuclease/exonuclease/phosphatase family protein [Aureimonas fodinaquatilis]KAA0970742.1 hypothetical protein FPY71_09695 [Aureimonas fodinaquatilis]
MRIVYANLGYARDIDGSFTKHVKRVHHHIFTPRDVQLRGLHFLKQTLRELQPDLSCFLEIDQGSLTNGFFDQFPLLCEAHHQTVRIDGKYSADKQFRRLSISRGKSSAFLATGQLPYTARYLQHGKKRLVYDIDLPGVRVLLAHCSLLGKVRERQLHQLADWASERDTPTIVIGDFNMFRGPRELAPLLKDGRFTYLNEALGPTFRLGPWRASLDPCLVSSDLASRCRVEIVDMPFSDHQMLMLDIGEPHELQTSLAKPDLARAG